MFVSELGDREDVLRNRRIENMKIEVAQMKDVLPQLDKVASTGALMANTVSALSEANTALGATLTSSGVRYADTPPALKVTKKSE